MSEPLTDEQLEGWEEGLRGKKGYSGHSYPGTSDLLTCIQEVRRLREERNDALAVEKSAMEIADTHLERAEKAERERDRYKDEADRRFEALNKIATAPWYFRTSDMMLTAQRALDQQEKS